MASPQYGSIAEPGAVALDLSEDAVRVRVKRRRDGADDGGDNDERGTGFVRSTVALLALFLFCSVLVASNYDLVVQTVLATSSKLELVTSSSSSSSSGPSPGSAPTVVATNTKVLTTPGTSTTSTSTSTSTSSSTSTSQSTTVLATGTVTGTAATDEAGLLVDFKMNRIGYTPINLSDDVLYYEFIRAKGYSVIYEPHAEMNLVVMDWTDSSVYYKCEFGSACLSRTAEL